MPMPLTFEAEVLLDSSNMQITTKSGERDLFIMY